MIKAAIQHLTDMTISPDERVVDIVDGSGNERTLVINSAGNFEEVKSVIIRADDQLRLNTLTGLVSYVKSNLERELSKLFLQIHDEKTVSIKGLLDTDGGRETLVVVNAIVPEFDYGYYLDTEEMTVAFQSKFTRTDDRDIVLKVIGNVKEDNVRKTGDTGVSQVVTIQTGIASADDVVVPNPIHLAPYRTFLEVEQPGSDFIFRMKDGPRGAIFEADGGAWRNHAIQNVRDYLEVELGREIESGRITIIA